MSAPALDELTWLAAKSPDGKVYYFHANSREVVWTLPEHVDPATVPLAVAPGSQEARHAEATGRLIPSPAAYPRTASAFVSSPASGGAAPVSRSPPSAAGPSAAALAAQNNAVTAVRTGKNALLFAGYLVRASAGWSTFTRRYCVVDPAAGSLRCFAHGPSVQALAAIFGEDHPAAESDEAAQSIAPVQGDLAASLAQGLLTERNEKSAVPLKGTRLRTEDIPGDVGAGQLNDTPVFTLTTAAGRIHRFVVEEGFEAHEDWITHLEAAIVAASGGGAPPHAAAGTGLGHSPHAHLSGADAERAARAEAAAKAAAEDRASAEAEEAAERAAEAEDAANAAAEAAAAAAAAAPRPAPPAVPKLSTQQPQQQHDEAPIDFAAQPPSSPLPRTQLSNEPDASGAPPSHGVDPAAIAAAQALIRSPDHAPDTLVGWMYKSDPQGRNWKYRYFVLHGTVLSYYTDSTRSQLKGSIILTADTLVDPSHGPDVMMGLGRRPRIEFRTEFPLYIGPPAQEPYGSPHSDQVSWAGRAYWMACESHEEAVDWAETLNSVVDAHRLLSGEQMDDGGGDGGHY